MNTYIYTHVSTYVIPIVIFSKVQQKYMYSFSLSGKRFPMEIFQEMTLEIIFKRKWGSLTKS